MIRRTLLVLTLIAGSLLDEQGTPLPCMKDIEP